ncbi:hypothetical protein Tco_1432252, partial [Tanacetum coccineum]
GLYVISTDSICSGDGGTAVGGGDGDIDNGNNGEGDLDLLRDEDGKSDGGAGLTSKVVISLLESDMMSNGANTLTRGVVAGKGVRRGVVIVL